MNADEIKSRISELCNAFVFDYNDKPCGVDPFSASDFDMWCGDSEMKAHSIDEVMTTQFFDGKSLTEIYDKIDIIEY